MYQNLFGNKMLDFNEETSPFGHIDSLFAGGSDKKISSLLLAEASSSGAASAFRLCIISRVSGGEHKLDEIRFSLHADNLGKLLPGDESSADANNDVLKQLFARNSRMLNLSGKQRPIDKQAFLEKSKKIPFVFDLMRAESLWQDRKIESGRQHAQTAAGLVYGKDSSTRDDAPTSLKPKRPLKAPVYVYLSDREKIFIFKFAAMDGSDSDDAEEQNELLKDNVYLFPLPALHQEDIVLDMRDGVAKELTRLTRRRRRGAQARELVLSPGFINEVEGKMEFCCIRRGEEHSSSILE